MDAGMQVALPILGVVAAAAATFYVVSFSELREANLHGKKYKCCCLSFMWKASEVRDDQMIVPTLYLALWQVKLLLGFDETKYTVIHQKHSKPCMSMLGTKTSPISINDSLSFRAYLKYERRHPVELERYRENQRAPITRRILVQFDRNITQLVVHFLTLKVELNLIKWDADSGGYTQTFI
ncbi:hypothetical protein NC652_015481 [Populus alba x Populus x berolinensis]|nr:hypothetical protein NC652_015481 [Populus alba x Populus x berolinensis]